MLGGVAERFNAPVLKTGGRKPTRVRIPPPPFISILASGTFLLIPGILAFEPARVSQKRAERVRPDGAARSRQIRAVTDEGTEEAPEAPRR